MLRLIAALGLAACASAIGAQAQVTAAANILLPDGRRNLLVSNHTSKTITAFAYQYRVSIQDAKSIPDQVLDEFKDSVIYAAEPAIGPGKEAAFVAGLLPIPGQRVLNLPAELKAVVFDDGSAFGERAWVARIRDRRLVAIETLDAELALLSSSPMTYGRRSTRESLAEELARLRPAWMKTDRDPDHQRVIQGQYDALTRNLTGANQGLDELEHLVHLQRDRMAKAAGIMYPAKLLDPDAGGRQ